MVSISEISLIRFGVINFFALLMQRSVFLPTTTVLCDLVKSIIEAETEKDKVMEGKINYIYEHTDERVDENISIVELAVFRNIERGLNQTIEINDKEFTIAELYNILNDVRWKLVGMVVEIAKKYTLEMPLMTTLGVGAKMDFGTLGTLQTTTQTQVEGMNEDGTETTY